MVSDLDAILGRHQRTLEKLLVEDLSGCASATHQAIESLRESLGELQLCQEQCRAQTDELIDARDALAREKQHYQELFDSAPGGYLVTDPLGIIGEANRAAGALLGVRPPDLAGRPLVNYVAAEQRKEVCRRLCKLQSPAAVTDGWEVCLQPRGGEPILALARVAPVKDAAGKTMELRWSVQDIRDRVALEDQLRESEQKFRRVFDEGTIGAALVGLDGRFLRVNRALAKILGYPEQELLTLRWQELTHPDDLAENLQNMRALLAGELRLYQADKRYLRSDGKPVWARLSVRVMRDAVGSPLYLLPMIQDITESKHLESLLRESWQRHALAESIAHFGTWERELESDTVVWSPECFRIFGLAPDREAPTFEELLGLIHPEDRERVRQAVLRQAETRSPLDLEYRIVLSGGEERVVRSVAQFVDDLGEGTKRLLGAVHDITAARQSERELQSAMEQFRTLADATPQLVWSARPDGSVDYYNSRIQEYAGIARDGSGSYAWAAVLHPEDQAAPRTSWQAAVDSGELYQVEHRMQMRDGAFRWHLSRAMPQRDPQGQVVRWFGTTTDIDERKTPQEQLLQARDAAQAAALTKSRFLASMSHEIRTPLSGVLGMTEVLLDTELSTEQADCVDAIQLSGKLLLGIANDILDLSRIEAGGLPLERMEFRLRDAVDDTLHLLAEPAQRKGLELCSLVEAEVPVKVLGDPGRFLQVLVNLVGNATKFIDRGEVAVRVNARRREGEPVWVWVEVADTGSGVPEELREEIFEPFSQADSSSQSRHGGTGLGLNVCKRLVAAMGGEIGFDSERGKGSRFWFSVPFSPSPDQGPHEPGFDGQRVLLVMGNATARRFAEDRLQQLGLVTLAIDQGLRAVAEARRAAAEGRVFQAVLVDRDLRDVDSLELATRFRAEPGLEALPLVVLTPVHRRHETLQAMEGATCRCVAKPLREAELRECLRSAFSDRPRVAPSRGVRARPGSPEPPKKCGRVLLAEDNEINRRVAEALLERCGCAVDTVHDGEEAVQAASLTRYDLILMDWRLPEVDGLEATRRIHSGTGASRHSPIVAMTANALPEHRQECLAAGMNDYVTKPLTGKVLEGVLGRWIGPAVEPHPQCPGRLPANLEELRELLGLQQLARLVRLVLETFPADIEHLDRLVHEADEAGLSRVAHGLKGKCAQFGTPRLIELCAKLEQAGESRAWGDAAEIVTGLRVEYGKYQVVLQEFLADLEPEDAPPEPAPEEPALVPE